MWGYRPNDSLRGVEVEIKKRTFRLDKQLYLENVQTGVPSCRYHTFRSRLGELSSIFSLRFVAE